MSTTLESSKAYQQRHISMGLCATCSQPLAVDSRRYCERHLARNREYCQKNRSRMRELWALRTQNHPTEWRDRIEGLQANPEALAAFRTRRRDISRKFRMSTPDKIAAHQYVARALRSGSLVRPSECEQCHIQCKPDAHHDDYKSPQNVRWLCKRCHGYTNKGTSRPL